MTDPDADALFRAIVRHPDDDTARLVFADWLQENGRTEEGEFVRTQCRLAAAEPDDPEYPALVDRDEELRLWLSAHAPGPRPTFPGGLSVDGGKLWWWQSHRGFPRFLEFDGYERYGAKAMRGLSSALARAFEALPTRWLVVRFISLAQLAALLKQPVLSGLTQFTLVSGYGGDEANEVARLVANCRHLRNLRGLALAVEFGDAGAEALAGAHWGNLEWFSPACHEMTPAGLRALADADWFRRLRELTLDDGLPGATFEALVRSPAFPRLHTLDVSRNGALTATGWELFARTRTFPALARLRCGEGDMSGDRFPLLAGAAGFDLHALDVRTCGLGPGSGAALGSAPWAGSLRALNLALNALEPADAKALAACKRFGNLQHLDLSGNALGPTCLSALASNPALHGLRSLRLDGRPFDNRGLAPTHFNRFLTKLNMPDLRHLDLSGRPVGATAAKKLADPKFSGLRRLALKGCKLSDTAVAKLVAAPALCNLIQLELNDNALKTGPKELGDPAVMPNLASCSLTGNPISAPVARKLRLRPVVSGLPKTAKRRS
ncbi:TIGR02996 domain-containing protein [Gemmata sp. G18]|uniref:TIGR02996 domain-containing protein n=1 Tax=Gemmata palustris TaxID=2822762 RepID=A0ABS5BZ04_9BACT|nr:TIGR02996 domain-containing protein [Gemmata palustris]MBP3958959.1 TIGR02996 domain-containing protein [Gemmata palustris]